MFNKSNLIKMKQLPKYLLFLILLCGMVSCKNSEKNLPITGSDQNQFSKRQQYIIDTSGISIIWTAYKFTNKIGVSGTFTNYMFENKKTSGTVEDLLSKSKLSIQTATVNSGNPIRDFKLDTYFFKTFNTSEIRGTISKIKKYEGIISLTMNGTSKNVPFTYAIEKDTVRLFTNLNLMFWNGEEALKTLNKECNELHKGADGISKLWPYVDITINLPIHKTLLTD